MTDQLKPAAYGRYCEEGSKEQKPTVSGGGDDYLCKEDDKFSESFRFWNTFEGTGGESREEFTSITGGSSGKGAVIEWNLMCSLEELYKGTTKKMKITRDVTDAFGRLSKMKEILEIKILPGWRKGTKITFPEKVYEQQGIIPSDLVFIVCERQHKLFKRHKNDLIITKKISLVESLTGFRVELTTLDGRNLTVHINSIVSPISEKIIEGEGMPISNEPTKRGNLIIKFNIKYPTELTQEQKIGIKRLLNRK